MSATTRNGQIVPALIRAAYPEHATKRVATAADVPLETARNYVRGRAEPSLSTLLRMAARCEQFAEKLEGLLHDRRAAALADRPVPMARQHAAADGGGKA